MRDFTGVTSLVLGGGGFIGINLCKRLARLGFDVRAYGRRPVYPDALKDVIWFQGEFNDRTALARAVEGTAVVFHLISGSIPDSSNKDPAADLASTAISTLHLLEICRASDVRKIVFISSGGTVYGPGAPTPTPETAATDPVSAYGISKLATEKYLRLYQHLHGLDYCILRVSNPYGPYQNPNRRQGIVAALMNRIMNGQDLEIWGSGDVVRDFVHVDDVAEAIAAVAGYEGSCKLFNVGSGVGRSIKQVVDAVMATMRVPGAKVVYRPGRATDVPVSVLDIQLIKREMGWMPRTDWIEGLQKTADWVRHNHQFNRA
jgi:UDP-glucose 4-epimerase